MKLLPCLVFNRSRIRVQPLHMTLQRFVLLRQLLQLMRQHPLIVPLFTKRRQPVMPEHNVVAKPHRQHPSRHRRNASPLPK